MQREPYDVIFLGGGPAGYVGAIRAAQLGMRVAVVDKSPLLGGTCLNVGCIPSKALLESSDLYHLTRNSLAKHGVLVGDVRLDLEALMGHKSSVVKSLGKGVEALFRRNKVDWKHGKGRLAGSDTVHFTSVEGSTEELRASHIIVATGSEPTMLPGVMVDRERVVTSDEAIAFDRVPEHLVVIGAGVVGVELGSVWLRLGAKVTVVEYTQNILGGSDKELATAAQRVFERQGFRFVLGARVSATEVANDRVITRYDQDGKASELVSDRVLVAVGRKPFTRELGIEALGVAVDPGGRIVVDERFRTNVANVYAIGDVIAGPMLAHKASEEGVAVVEFIAGQIPEVMYEAIPSIVYTDPEIASVGATEEQLIARSVPFRKGVFQYQANARAKAMLKTEGFAKVLAHAETNQVLGAHLLGAAAGELIPQVAIAMQFHASAEDLALTTYAHPTLAEVVKEAALGCLGRMLHS